MYVFPHALNKTLGAINFTHVFYKKNFTHAINYMDESPNIYRRSSVAHDQANNTSYWVINIKDE